MSGGTYVDGCLIHNNKSELAILEVHKIWEKGRTFCLLSIGDRVVQTSLKVQETPPQSNQSCPEYLAPQLRPQLPEWKPSKEFVETCVHLAVNCQNVHRRVNLLAKSNNLFIPFQSRQGYGRRRSGRIEKDE